MSDLRPPVIRLPWGAFLLEEERELALPRGFSLDVAELAGLEGGASVEEALDAPVESPPLEELARGAESVAIAVEDITRPSFAGPALDAILDRLASVGIASSQVRVIVALGGHAPLRLPELCLKLGERVVDTCDVWNHHPYENLVDLGRSKSGIPILVNRLFVEADLRLALGSVVPHPYAGFGGGGKIVLPGLAGIDTLEMNHRPAVTGLSGAGLGVVAGNRAREEMEEIALAAGLQAVLNIVPGRRRAALAHVFGHPVAAHRRAVELARVAHSAPLTPGAELVVLNAYPKDAELLQVGNAFNAYRALGEPLAAEGGTVVVTAACPHGRGYHSLHGPRMRLYRDPIERPYLAGRELIVYAPSLSEADVRKSFWEGYPHARSWDEVVARVEERHPQGGRALVVPEGPLTLPVRAEVGVSS